MQKIILNKKVVYYEICNKGVVDKYSLLKKLSKDVFGIEAVIIKKNGKPSISHFLNLFCSASDSQDLVFVALCKDFKIGIDVEYLRTRKAELLSYCCDQKELIQMKRVFPNMKNLESIIWSLKESVQKSDEIIFNQNEYKITNSDLSRIIIKRGRNTWLSKVWEENNYVFCISVKTS